MTKVDELVRKMMLTYPTLYPSRPVALYNIFTDTGTNYEWDENGCIVEAYPVEKDFDGTIDISDLAMSDEQWDRDDDFARTIRIQNELERRNRLYRAEHIDLLCQYGGRASYGYKQLDWYTLDKMTGDYGVALLYSAPFGQIDAAWLRVMTLFVHDMLVAFNHTYNVHLDRPIRGEKAPEPSMYSWMPSIMRSRYDNIRSVAKRLEEQRAAAGLSPSFSSNLFEGLAESPIDGL